ncbi:MAG: deoxyguanosinetriphosphate triphosphohydrolase [Winogradskyella sp.]|uniref:deoxyguanosinetriphosphate triphosphohydrolase n=1 Tax=Winogradskyella sp. TaxID=1883156 RepID=UPI00184C2DE8|nr:deoxyguanosinetriphosphate triphosphohydrolase [Winogradskyella sp.]MBT8245294.1 deoxyguanosinetriphosphate triphosphohydrolase [Winogradskyella sp.]NNK23289.1 deoxyguanosinetriphosphate triphosphohydrolase [Winogradskyella sp.]
MNWEQLLSLKRYGDTNKRLRKEQDETRLGFEVDYDRIIFSSEFRSLQDKTQVVPLSKTDFVHTRLTHSLEVSVVGRSLGRQVGRLLLQKYPHLQNIHGYQANDFGAIVAAAALAHDIGNPPFGHSGEKTIGAYFKDGAGKSLKSALTDKQYQDLCDFEGNANGFKILTESRIGREGGLRLSYATLGAFMKYPKASLPKKPTLHIADKKYGFFQSEEDTFIAISEELGLNVRDKENTSFARHPLAFLVEAADDICYTIIDFEDGINLGLIEEEYALEYLIKLVKNTINTDKYSALKTTEDRVSYLRALAIGTLINEAVSIFIANEDKILLGEFDTGLLDVSSYKAQIKDIINISIKNVYQSEEVVNKEIAGYRVLDGLLSTFVTVANNVYTGNLSAYDKLVIKALPETVSLSNSSLYENIMAVCLYISKLSDSNAMALFHRINGNSI